MINKTLLSILILLLISLTGCSTKEKHITLNSITVEANTQKPISQDNSFDIEIKENYMKIGTWDLKVDEVEMFHAPGASIKRTSTNMTLSNLEGRDKSFTPTGEITALVGTSGKVYGDFKQKMSLNEYYEGTKQSRKEISERGAESMPYEEGVFRWGINIPVDAVETGITAIIYTDENGEKHKIPVSIEPTIEEPSPSAK